MGVCGGVGPMPLHAKNTHSLPQGLSLSLLKKNSPGKNVMEKVGRGEGSLSFSVTSQSLASVRAGQRPHRPVGTEATAGEVHFGASFLSFRSFF